MRLAVAFSALVVATGPALADAATECVASALTDYSRQSLALFQAVPIGSLPGVDALIAKRRLQEGYCLRSTRCLYGELSTGASDLAFRAEFAKCLNEEAERGK